MPTIAFSKTVIDQNSTIAQADRNSWTDTFEQKNCSIKNKNHTENGKTEQELTNYKERKEEMDKEGGGYSEENEEDVNKEGNSTCTICHLKMLNMIFEKITI